MSMAPWTSSLKGVTVSLLEAEDSEGSWLSRRCRSLLRVLLLGALGILRLEACVASIVSMAAATLDYYTFLLAKCPIFPLRELCNLCFMMCSWSLGVGQIRSSSGSSISAGEQ